MERWVEVTVGLVGAWEVWEVSVPEDVDEDWIKANLSQCEIRVTDSGSDSIDITEIDLRDDPKEQEVIVDVEP